MLRVCLVGLLAGGRSGVPRYTAQLTTALDRIAPEFPDLSLVLLTTPAGARASLTSAIEIFEHIGDQVGMAETASLLASLN